MGIGLTGSLALASMAAEAAYQTHLDEMGYHQLSPKQIIIDDIPVGAEPKQVTFALYDPKAPGLLPFQLGKVVYKFKTITAQSDPRQHGPGTNHWVLDFSDFTQSGEFQLLIDGAKPDLPSSTAPVNPVLTISEFVYWDALKPVIRSFYLHRLGQSIEDPQSGISLGLSYPEDALLTDLKTGEIYRKDVAGGWMNGSDYNKYTTPTSLSCALLLSAFEANPKTMKLLKLDYPLSEPALATVSDLLQEVRYGLDWVMAMQRNDGAFYRKVAGKLWPEPKTLPEEDNQPRNIFGVTSQDTALASGSLALTSRVWKKTDMSYAVKALMAAERGWVYLAKHPNWEADIAPNDDSGSKEYLYPKGELAQRFWAAAELYTSTGKATYHQYLKAHYKEVIIEPPSWENPVLIGLVDYLRYAPNPDPQLVKYFKANIQQAAKLISQRIQSDPYASTLVTYPDESNVKLLQHLMFLLSAYELSPNAPSSVNYLHHAARSFRNLTGINPLGVSYVTGLGKHSPQFPHHALAQATKIAIPGMLVSGPNGVFIDRDWDRKTPVGLGPLSYDDHSDAVASNRSEILYNAMLANILARLNEGYNHLQQSMVTVPTTGGQALPVIRSLQKQSLEERP